jgi:hypothetical protein
MKPSRKRCDRQRQGCRANLIPRPKPVSRLEAQHVGDRDAIQTTADSPGRKDFGVDELVDRFATELPPTAKLSDRQPGGTRSGCDRAGRRAMRSAPYRWRMKPALCTHDRLLSRKSLRVNQQTMSFSKNLHHDSSISSSASARALKQCVSSSAQAMRQLERGRQKLC